MWEVIDDRRCDEITLKESDLNTVFEFASVPKTSNKKSEQDTSLFKIRYKYAGNPKGERVFCNKLIEANKLFRAEDLDANYNYNEELAPEGTDSYNIFKFKGGVNCKHWWQRVVFLKKGNKSISVNQAKKMILALEPSERADAKWKTNDKEVAQVAESKNNYWSLKPNYRNSGVTPTKLSLKEKLFKLAGFDPNQERAKDGKWIDEAEEFDYGWGITNPETEAEEDDYQKTIDDKREQDFKKRNYDPTWAKTYKEAFKNKVKYQSLKEGHYNAHHLFVIEVEDRKGLYDFLRSNNIFAQIHYIPVHTLPYYQKIGYDKAELSNSENYYSKCISLPMFPSLTNEEQEFVIEKILSF